MPSLNSSRFAGRPTTHGHQAGLRQVCTGQPTEQELRRMQLLRVAAHVGVKIPECHTTPAVGPRVVYDDVGRKRKFKVEVRAKKVLRKPH